MKLSPGYFHGYVKKNRGIFPGSSSSKSYSLSTLQSGPTNQPTVITKPGQEIMCCIYHPLWPLVGVWPQTTKKNSKTKTGWLRKADADGGWKNADEKLLKKKLFHEINQVGVIVRLGNSRLVTFSSSLSLRLSLIETFEVSLRIAAARAPEH